MTREDPGCASWFDTLLEGVARGDAAHATAVGIARNPSSVE